LTGRTYGLIYTHAYLSVTITENCFQPPDMENLIKPPWLKL